MCKSCRTDEDILLDTKSVRELLGRVPSTAPRDDGQLMHVTIPIGRVGSSGLLPDSDARLATSSNGGG